MKNFFYDIGTKIYFGEGSIENLGPAIKPYSDKVLLCYGGGSVKKTGVYDDVVNSLKASGIEWVELSGIEPNPRVTSVNEGVRLCREHNITAVLAVGGGSTIDCSKVIAAGVAYEGDAWDLVIGKASITKVLPVFSVLTLSATGSEMDPTAVISNMDTNDKLGVKHPDMRPVASILDPKYTYTVSKYQTAAGTADIMSHIFEIYFSTVKSAYIADRMAEAMLKTCINYGVVAVNDPENYEARANLMWCSSLAINNLLSYGKGTAWSVHSMEHQLSAYYDITHGVGLAILTPHWMRYVLNEETVDKFVEYAKNVWDIDCDGDKFAAANKAIDKTAEYFKAMGIPMTLTEVGIDETHFDIMAEKAAAKYANIFVPLTKEDVKNIYRMSL
ncbi:MAG: iron-containing alcohol dehydrogenase [Clostridia bacterium]|nr:iron-containing alcohol dehydrogenase [Clostridia bacterium]